MNKRDILDSILLGIIAYVVLTWLWPVICYIVVFLKNVITYPFTVMKRRRMTKDIIVQDEE